MASFSPQRTNRTGKARRNQRQVLLINAGKARRETVNGRAYLVAPMTIIVPGVLNGSRGALLYPPSEVAKEPGLWNGVPICDGHPTENGSHVSGRTPATMASHWMGHVFNDRWDGSKRTAEGWFDVEATKRVNPAIHNRLERGDSIELSTGLFTDNHDRRGVFNGKPYDAIAYNYRPDHLAILHDQPGACSRSDGCGVMVNAFCPTGEGGGVDPSCGIAGGEHPSLQSLSSRSSETDVYKGFSEIKKTGTAAQAKEFLDKVVATKGQAALRSLANDHGVPTAKNPGGKGTDLATPLVIRDRIVAKTHATRNVDEGRDEAGKFAPGGDPKDKAKSADDGKPAELPKAALVGSPEAEQRIAKQIGNQNTDQSGPAKACKCGGSCDACAAEVSPEPIARNAFCPTGSGGGIDPSCGHGDGGKGGGVKQAQSAVNHAKAVLKAHDDATEAGRKVFDDAFKGIADQHRSKVDAAKAAYASRMAEIAKKYADKAAAKKKTNNQRSFLMAKGKKKNGREEALDWLTANSEAFGADGTREALDDLPDAVLEEIRANAEHIEEKNLVCNALAEMFPEVNEIVGNGGDLKAFLASKLGGGQDDGDEQDSELEPPMQKTKNAGACAGEQKGTMMAGNHASQNRAAKRPSLNEMIQQHGSDEDRSAWSAMIDNEREQRKELLTRITANCASKVEAKAMWDSLKGDPLPKLKLLANRLSPERAAEEPRNGGNGLFGAGRRIPDYGGAAGAVPTGNRRRAQADDEDDGTLDLPDSRAILANESNA